MKEKRRNIPVRFDLVRHARWLAPLMIAAIFAFGAESLAGQLGGNAAGSARIEEMHIDGDVEPILATYIDSGLEEAVRTHASLVLITMDTPGGLSSSMQDIIKHILDSPVPVVVYVSPKGARGASAGFFILLSADVAAMAPATHAGAASPVFMIGGYTVNIDETMRRKVMEDAKAFLRSYTEKRGRNPALAETAVSEAKAFTEKEALDGKLIDLLADSPEDLLTKLNGRTIKRFDGKTVTLELPNPVRAAYEMSARQKFLSRIVQPDVFFVLLILGVLGLYTEFTHPGMIAPGVIGGICAVLALYAMNILPVNFAGLLLIALALAMFILEAKYASHGILGIGGVVAMLLGALMLIRSPLTNAGVSVGVAAGMTLPFAGISIFLMRLVLRSRSWKQSTGLEQLAGSEGQVTEALVSLAPGGPARGMVRVHGELWRAVANAEVPKDTPIRVLKADGLTLHVEPKQTSPNAGD